MSECGGERCARCAFALLHQRLHGGEWLGCEGGDSRTLALQDGDGARWLMGAERKRAVADLLLLMERAMPEHLGLAIATLHAAANNASDKAH